MRIREALTLLLAGAAGLAGAPAVAATTTPPPAPPPTTPPTTVAPTTTLPPMPAGVFNPACAWVVRPGDSLSLIADESGQPDATTATLRAENGFGTDHVIHAGELLDVCVGNEVNDLNGASRSRPATTLIPDDPAAVQRQQQKLNELFGPFGMPALAVDGDSGPLTRQQLCAARVLLGLPVSRSDMAAGSPEEAALFATAAVPVPPDAPTAGDRWALLDMTCQVLIVGDRSSGVRFILPTSTGEAGFETRVVREAAAFRFDPAVDNDGWHDSSEFPSAYDNPLNGNMYKPLYFSNGQAIHGANNVPPRPASKGCARLRVDHHDALLAWLGLADAAGPVWAESRIDLVVTTQGAYLPDP